LPLPRSRPFSPFPHSLSRRIKALRLARRLVQSAVPLLAALLGRQLVQALVRRLAALPPDRTGMS
jgi:hypothetical protein